MGMHAEDEKRREDKERQCVCDRESQVGCYVRDRL